MTERRHRRSPALDARVAEPLVGMFCNCTMNADPKKTLSTSQINRAFLIDRLLAASGAGLFLCSPRGVTAADQVVGYLVEGDGFVRATRPLPPAPLGMPSRTPSVGGLQSALTA